MAVNFLYRGRESGGWIVERKAQVKMAATVILVIILVVVAGMLGVGVYIGREKRRLVSEETKLRSDEVKLAAAEARVWQIDDRVQVVLAEVKSSLRMAEIMQKVTPGEEVELVGWTWVGDSGSLEVEAVYPEILERYAQNLRSAFPQVDVTNVTWGEASRWRISLSLGGVKK